MTYKGRGCQMSGNDDRNVGRSCFDTAVVNQYRDNDCEGKQLELQAALFFKETASGCDARGSRKDGPICAQTLVFGTYIPTCGL